MKQPLEKITSEFMADTQRYPGFTAAVRAAKDSAVRPTLEASLKQFHDDPFGLYACLWYAWSNGVRVVFGASDEEALD